MSVLNGKPLWSFYKFHYNGHALEYHNDQKKYMSRSDHEEYQRYDGKECMANLEDKWWRPGKGWATKAYFARYHEAKELIVYVSELEEVEEE